VLRTFFPEQSGLLLDSQKVVPEKLLASGFEFQFPCLPEALANLIKSKNASFSSSSSSSNPAARSDGVME
jgi:hypothetical protein